MANEITKPVQLCDEKGRLNKASVGWARKPIIDCNVTGTYLRKKKWNYWCFTNDAALFSVTISTLDYAAMIFAYVLDRKTLTFKEQSILIPFEKGVSMPDNANESIHVKRKNTSISYEEKGDETIISVYWDQFDGGEPLEANLTVKRHDEQESLNVVIPWSEKRFQFTSKQVALPASGSVKWNHGTYHFGTKNSFATLDFGRGKWPYASTWNWGAASGYSGDLKIGLNFGGQWTDGTGQTENGILINDVLHKIHEDVTWIYDERDYMKMWVLQTDNSKQVLLTFQPEFERVAKSNVGIIQSEVHQMIGHYNGTITLENGEKVEINNLFGWAEDHKAKW